MNDNGTIEVRQRMATPRDDYDGTVRAITALVAAMDRHTGPSRRRYGNTGAVEATSTR